MIFSPDVMRGLLEPPQRNVISPILSDLEMIVAPVICMYTKNTCCFISLFADALIWRIPIHDGLRTTARRQEPYGALTPPRPPGFSTLENKGMAVGRWDKPQKRWVWACS